MDKTYTFLDYIMGGLQLNCTVTINQLATNCDTIEVLVSHHFLVVDVYSPTFQIAVDFTGSNGDPQYPRSLHFIGAPEGNQYQQAWLAIGNIIQDYDS